MTDDPDLAAARQLAADVGAMWHGVVTLERLEPGEGTWASWRATIRTADGSRAVGAGDNPSEAIAALVGMLGARRTA